MNYLKSVLMLFFAFLLGFEFNALAQRPSTAEEACSFYDRRGNREYCEDLLIDPVKIWELHNYLKTPNFTTNLKLIEPYAFNVYLEISSAPWERIIRRYDPREVQNVLFWIIANPAISEVLKRQDFYLEILEALLKKNARLYKYDISGGFTARLDDRRTVIEVAVQHGSAFTLDWFKDYIHSDYSCIDIKSVSCFEIYCKIGSTLNNPNEWLYVDPSFQNYINSIIVEGVNASGGDSSNGYYWGDSSKVYKNLNSLGNNNWVNALCI